MTAPKVMRLNWGAGGAGEPGWWNSDLKRGPGIQLPADVRVGLPVRAGAFDYAVSVHALQEIAYPDLPAALGELRRVLKRDAPLRLVLPDLDLGVDAYRRGDAAYFEVPDDDARSPGAKLVTQILWYGYSRTVFTWDFARELLARAGFREIRRSAYRQTGTRFPEITSLDSRPRESLYIEAVR